MIIPPTNTIMPQAESVRGKSLFGYSFVQVTFSDSRLSIESLLLRRYMLVF